MQRFPQIVQQLLLSVICSVRNSDKIHNSFSIDLMPQTSCGFKRSLGSDQNWHLGERFRSCRLDVAFPIPLPVTNKRREGDMHSVGSVLQLDIHQCPFAYRQAALSVDVKTFGKVGYKVSP